MDEFFDFVFISSCNLVVCQQIRRKEENESTRDKIRSDRHLSNSKPTKMHIRQKKYRSIGSFATTHCLS